MSRSSVKAALRVKNKAEILIHVRDQWASVWTENGWKTTPYQKYYLGKKAPNFPMPAIVAKAVIFPDYIAFIQYNGRQGLYGPGYVSVAYLFKH